MTERSAGFGVSALVLQVGAELAQLDDRRPAPADRVGREGQRERNLVLFGGGGVRKTIGVAALEMRRSPTVRDEELMAEALVEAEKSLHVDEFPVGAVVVLDDEVVARAHWMGASQLRLLDHAELVALLEAERGGRVTRRRERREAVLYTTLEPCALCMAAAMSFLLGKIVYAAEAPVDGGTNLPLLWKPPLGHPANAMPYAIPEVLGGVARDASVALIAEWVRRKPDRQWAAPYIRT